MNWRDSLSDASPPFAVNSINQRLNLVAAIIRTGWRDAEMAEQNLKALTLTDTDENDRQSWQREEILKALTMLEPNSWHAWLYLIGLTTSVRMGEPMAARVGWFDPKTGMIEVLDRKYTKAHKLHCMPIITMLREPLIRYIGGRPRDEYLLADAPRPGNPKLPIAHESSKWFGRFFHKHEINRVFHELRDTWIEAAKHSTVEKDIWEIISGHSAATTSDRYGGKKSNVLAKSNETICKFLTKDAEIKSAMLALVA
jgi:integrase